MWSTLPRNYIEPCYIQTISEIRKLVEDSNIWFSVDKTTDINGHYIANFIVGILSAENVGQSYAF